MEVGIAKFKANVDQFTINQKYLYLSEMNEVWLLGVYGDKAAEIIISICSSNKHRHPDLFLDYNTYPVLKLSDVQRRFSELESKWISR